MAALSDILTDWTNLQNDVMEELYMDKTVIEVSEPIEVYPFLCDKIKTDSSSVRGLQAKIPFRHVGNNSWRSMDQRDGYTPVGNVIDTDNQTFDLVGYAASATVSHRDIIATDGDHYLMADLGIQAIEDLYRQLPRYKRQFMWTGTSGVVAVASAAISGSTVSIDNDGLEHTETRDLTKYIWENMFLSVYSSANAFKGIVQVTSVDRTNGTFTIDADTSPTAIADGDQFVVSDVEGEEDDFNNSGPGILDVIDEANTFQGINRSTAANHWARAVVNDNSGTGRYPTYARLSDFFHDVYGPKEAYTSFKVIQSYWETNGREKVRLQVKQDFSEDFNKFVMIDDVKMYWAEDCHQDKIIVPDLSNICYFTKGAPAPYRGEGWKRVHKRPIFEYVLAGFHLLGAKNCRMMGKFEDVDITAAS